MKFVYIALILAAIGACAMADVKCTACETVITLVDNWLDEGKTHEEIKKLVTQVCSYVGPKYADICSALLDGELEQIIKLIESMEPEQVCEYIKLCPTELNDQTGCAVCKFIVDALEQYVEDPHTEQQIVNLLDRLCTMFPKYESVCDQLVAYGVMELVELIKEKGDPQEVCQIVKLC